MQHGSASSTAASPQFTRPKVDTETTAQQPKPVEPLTPPATEKKGKAGTPAPAPAATPAPHHQAGSGSAEPLAAARAASKTVATKAPKTSAAVVVPATTTATGTLARVAPSSASVAAEQTKPVTAPPPSAGPTGPHPPAGAPLTPRHSQHPVKATAPQSSPTPRPASTSTMSAIVSLSLTSALDQSSVASPSPAPLEAPAPASAQGAAKSNVAVGVGPTMSAALQGRGSGAKPAAPAAQLVNKRPEAPRQLAPVISFTAAQGQMDLLPSASALALDGPTDPPAPQLDLKPALHRPPRRNRHSGSVDGALLSFRPAPCEADTATATPQQQGGLQPDGAPASWFQLSLDLAKELELDPDFAQLGKGGRLPLGVDSPRPTSLRHSPGGSSVTTPALTTSPGPSPPRPLRVGQQQQQGRPQGGERPTPRLGPRLGAGGADVVKGERGGGQSFSPSSLPLPDSGWRPPQTAAARKLPIPDPRQGSCQEQGKCMQEAYSPGWPCSAWMVPGSLCPPSQWWVLAVVMRLSNAVAGARDGGAKGGLRGWDAGGAVESVGRCCRGRGGRAGREPGPGRTSPASSVPSPPSPPSAPQPAVGAGQQPPGQGPGPGQQGGSSPGAREGGAQARGAGPHPISPTGPQPWAGAGPSGGGGPGALPDPHKALPGHQAPARAHLGPPSPSAMQAPSLVAHAKSDGAKATVLPSLVKSGSGQREGAGVRLGCSSSQNDVMGLMRFPPAHAGPGGDNMF
ncbi:hypothetical protein HaLaN_07963 [Haematococcus lacustris]|uniref:Uncharacterized protein n=1 Tax=Haematococcus lacustris TaxID=44745 RepID=A0A699YZA0_HAELA|nr:hypothetical protein HaLaN_07963 [Haematococcus lacustris]